MTVSVVTGAAGFIGHHLCRALKDRGHYVRAVDWKPCPYETGADEEYWDLDLRDYNCAFAALGGADQVWALAADMGGIGYITKKHWRIIQNNTRINLNTAMAAEQNRVKRLMFTSSACVYPEALQMGMEINLSETDAWKGRPDTAYGIEKLYAETIYQTLGPAAGVAVRIARLHNVYGTECTWQGGREKAPAAICRKVAQASGKIQLWGDGKQVRSFCHVNDCLDMLIALMEKGGPWPINIGTDRAVTVDELARIVMDAAGVDLEIEHIPTGPTGVRYRNADMTMGQRVMECGPRISLEDGMAELYRWVEREAFA